MKVVGLLSGGKDSCFNLCHCVRQGHELVAVATLAPPTGKDEIDSYMYQTVGHDAVHLVAQALDVPLYRHSITGQAVNQDLQYRQDSSSAQTVKDETEDLFDLLLEVKKRHPDVEGVSVGAILSNYQRTRVEHVALRPELQLTPLTYLWQRSQDDLLDEMVKAGMNAVLIKVAGIGLDERDLGKSLAQMQSKLRRLNGTYGAHICGEGGEYETLTLDCPLFKHRIDLRKTEVVTHAEAAFASVAYLRIAEAVLVPKDEDAPPSLTTVHIPAELDSFGQRTLASIKTVSSALSQDIESLAVSDSMRPSPAELARSPPVLTRSPHWVHISNLNGLQSDGSVPSSIEAETEQMFDALRDTLARADLNLRHLTHVNLYLASQDDFGRINAVYKSRFHEGPPSRACVGIRVRPGDRRRVFLDATGVDDPTVQQSLHVQGRSYWAPANIGPYSQAMLARERISIAGQIGLRPADLSLPVEDFDLQCALALQHARRIHLAVLEGAGISSVGDAAVEGGICWIADGPEGLTNIRLDRVCKAHAGWVSQASAALGIEDAADDDSDDSNPDTARADVAASTDWLGVGRRPEDLPMLYAVVPAQGLPRGAGVEWQLTAVTGRSASQRKDSDEDSDGDDLVRPTASLQRGSVDIALDEQRHIQVSWRSSRCAKSESSLGILTARTIDSRSSSSSEDGAEGLRGLGVQLEKEAFFFRLFVPNTTRLPDDEELTSDALLRLLQGPDKDQPSLRKLFQTVPVSALFAVAHVSSPPSSTSAAPHSSRPLEPVDVAIVWAGVCSAD
ncbi:hypothetical protein V8E36_001353 [Tilletia maclaganii]